MLIKCLIESGFKKVKCLNAESAQHSPGSKETLQRGPTISKISSKERSDDIELISAAATSLQVLWCYQEGWSWIPGVMHQLPTCLFVIKVRTSVIMPHSQRA